MNKFSSIVTIVSATIHKHINIPKTIKKAIIALLIATPPVSLNLTNVTN
jgi:hypothetical protein